jgi:hypothetical protein
MSLVVKFYDKGATIRTISGFEQFVLSCYEGTSGTSVVPTVALSKHALLPCRWKSSVEDAVESVPGVETSAAPESTGLCPCSSQDGTRKYRATSTGTIPPIPLSCDLASLTVGDAFSHLKAAFTLVHFDTLAGFFLSSTQVDARLSPLSSNSECAPTEPLLWRLRLEMDCLSRDDADGFGLAFVSDRMDSRMVSANAVSFSSSGQSSRTSSSRCIFSRLLRCSRSRTRRCSRAFCSRSSSICSMSLYSFSRWSKASSAAMAGANVDADRE